MSASKLPAVIRAANFAAFKHRNQRRKDADASPYINHPLALADVLVNEAGINDAAVICAALLHDTIEDTETTATELAERFGWLTRYATCDIASNPPAAWSTERKRKYFDWAKQVVDGIRGANRRLATLFDEAYSQRP
jgi:guanosine-3',5'-bis(diphosphate) 3'-pyrophosphohydrolase